MKHAFTSVVIIAFAGLLCSSLTTVFGNSKIGSEVLSSQTFHNPYFMAF